MSKFLPALYQKIVSDNLWVVSLCLAKTKTGNFKYSDRKSKWIGYRRLHQTLTGRFFSAINIQLCFCYEYLFQGQTLSSQNSILIPLQRCIQNIAKHLGV